MEITPEIAIRFVWVAWFVSWMGAAWWSNRTVEKPPRDREMAYRLLSIVGAVLLFGIRSRPTQLVLWQTNTVIGWGMAALNVVGFGFTWWARIVLGRLWSSTVTQKEGHHVVDTGPYAIVRHPIYTGITLASFAAAAESGTVLAFAGAAILTLSWYVKARLEEAFLREKLGKQQYDAYARRVPMLIPFVRF
jgi:protein-S-isoprenylcysteine O-methyltransferase Ste14